MASGVDSGLDGEVVPLIDATNKVSIKVCVYFLFLPCCVPLKIPTGRRGIGTSSVFALPLLSMKRQT